MVKKVKRKTVLTLLHKALPWLLMHLALTSMLGLAVWFAVETALNRKWGC